MSRSVKMKSPVNWAVLGLVIERPSYGYELFHRFERRYAGVLNPVMSQIYAALDTLERGRLVEPITGTAGTAETPAPRQPKVEYRATATGARAFREWVAEQMHGDPQHVELLRRIAALPGAGFDHVDLMRELVDHYERVCVEEASRMPLSSRPESSGSPVAVSELAERLVLAARRELLDGHFRWIDRARKEIDAFAQRAPEDDEPARA